jgi:hypothetical protein
MKRLLLALIAAVALIAVAAIAFKIGQASGAASARLTRDLEEWTAVVQPRIAQSLAVSASICTNADCGFRGLLKVWHALDTAHSAYQRPAPPVSVLALSKEQLSNAVTESSRTYVRLLPVLHGALDAQDFQFEDYLLMRSEVAKCIGVGETNESVKFFIYSVGQQTRALQDFFQPHDASAGSRLKFTDSACRDLLLDYLRKGQHVSADEEHWIGIDGPSRLAMHGTSNWKRRGGP